jgi:elongation factor P
MADVSVTNLRGGLLVELDGTVFSIIEYQHVKPGKGGAFVRTKMRNVKQGKVVERTFKASEKLEVADVDKKEVQFQYRAGDEYHFMDMNTFEDVVLPSEALGENLNYLTEGMELEVWIYQGEPIGIEMPITVELEVTEAPPAFKGNTASGNNKPVTLETGLVVQVPYFIESGDVLKIDTRTGDYIERVKK